MLKLIVGPIVSLFFFYIGAAALIFAVASNLGHDPAAGALAVRHAAHSVYVFAGAVLPSFVDLLRQIFSAIGQGLNG